MLRVIVFLAVIAAAALGATWLADQSGTLTLVVDRWQIETSLPVFMLATGVLVAVMVAAWSLLRFLWRLPQRAAAARQRRRVARGREAITRGLDCHRLRRSACCKPSGSPRQKLAHNDALSLVLRAQAAQLAGDHAEAREAFHDMASRADTRLFGLRGLFIEAQRSDDPLGAVAVAEEALKLAPASGWASQAVLGFRCAKGDWDGALAIIDSNKSSGLLSAPEWRRQRAVLLTAQALDVESSDRDRSRSLVMAALKLAPTLIPAATLAAKYFSESGEVRRAMRAIEIRLARTAASRSIRCLYSCAAWRFRARTSGACRDISVTHARRTRRRIGIGARRHRRDRIRAGARGSCSIHRRADAARRHADGRT